MVSYEKDQYSSGFHVCYLIIAAILLWIGFQWLLNPTNPPNFWWFISFFLILGGIGIVSGQIYALANRRHLRNAVKEEFKRYPDITVEQVSISTGITKKDVNAIVLDLKARRELRGSFSSETGQIKIIPVEDDEDAREKKIYCVDCGTPFEDESAVYCSYCGSKL